LRECVHTFIFYCFFVKFFQFFGLDLGYGKSFNCYVRWGGGVLDKGVKRMKPSGSADQTADLRDSVSALVGGGYKSLTDDDSKANFSRIASLIGIKNAQNLFLHISQQNQRPGWNAMKPAERVSKFYDIPSSDPSTNGVLQNIKSFGSGPMAGYTDSVNYLNQIQQGNAPSNAALNAMVSRK
jgi:hypothetical protein